MYETHRTKTASIFPAAEIHSAYEAGFSGFELHRELQRQGVKSIVVHAAAIEVAANNRVKTDKWDARKIAEHLEAGRVRGIRSTVMSHHRVWKALEQEIAQCCQRQ